jgi:hypothetical protein
MRIISKKGKVFFKDNGEGYWADDFALSKTCLYRLYTSRSDNQTQTPIEVMNVIPLARLRRLLKEPRSVIGTGGPNNYTAYIRRGKLSIGCVTFSQAHTKRIMNTVKRLVKKP